jgi:hypothetical protein
VPGILWRPATSLAASPVRPSLRGPLIGAILTLGVFGVSIWWRRKRGRSTDHVFALKLIGIAAGVGSMSVGALYPLGYVLISKALHGGAIASNLPAGVTEDALLGMALLGGATVAIGIIYTLLEHLKSEDAPKQMDRDD